MLKGAVNLKTLKNFVFENFPASCTLRDIILSEPDQMTRQEFVIKVGVWLKLLALSLGGLKDERR